MTKLVAFYMVWNAQRYLLSWVPRYRPVTEEPDLYAAIETLRVSERQLRTELKGVLEGG